MRILPLFLIIVFILVIFSITYTFLNMNTAFQHAAQNLAMKTPKKCIEENYQGLFTTFSWTKKSTTNKKFKKDTLYQYVTALRPSKNIRTVRHNSHAIPII